MGNVIAYWGARAGQTGSSSNLVSSAAVLAMDYVSRILVGHTQYGGSLVEDAFRRQQRSLDEMSLRYSPLGIDSLEMLARSGQLTPAMMKDYTMPVFSGSLDLLPGTNKPDRHMLMSMHEVAGSICEAARSAYDLTLLDVGSGEGDSLMDAMLDSADLVVISLSQNMSMLRQFFHHPPTWLDSKKVVLVLGQYDSSSRLTAANIRRLFKIKAPLFTIPHSSGYMDACNEQRVVEFFLKRKHVQRDQPDYGLLQEVRKLNRGIFDTLAVDHNMFAKEA